MKVLHTIAEHINTRCLPSPPFDPSTQALTETNLLLINMQMLFALAMSIGAVNQLPDNIMISARVCTAINLDVLLLSFFFLLLFSLSFHIPSSHLVVVMPAMSSACFIAEQPFATHSSCSGISPTSKCPIPYVHILTLMLYTTAEQPRLILAIIICYGSERWYVHISTRPIRKN